MTKYQKLMHQAINTAVEELKGTKEFDNYYYFIGYVHGIYKWLLRKEQEKVNA